jgi:hypothetical protein
LVALRTRSKATLASLSKSSRCQSGLRELDGTEDEDEREV